MAFPSNEKREHRGNNKTEAGTDDNNNRTIFLLFVVKLVFSQSCSVALLMEN